MTKVIALGAHVCGIVLPFLKLLDRRGSASVADYIDCLKADFARAMLLIRCARTHNLRKTPLILSPQLQDAFAKT